MSIIINSNYFLNCVFFRKLRTYIIKEQRISNLYVRISPEILKGFVELERIPEYANFNIFKKENLVEPIFLSFLIYSISF